MTRSLSILGSLLLVTACTHPATGAGGSGSTSTVSSTTSTHAHAVAATNSVGGSGGAGGVGPVGTTATGIAMQCGMDQSSAAVTASSTTSSASTTTGSGGFVTAPHIPLPPVTGNATAVLAQMELVTITLPGDAHRPTEEAFGDFVLGSSWYATAGADYGVGAGTELAKVALTDTLPAHPTNGDIVTLLTNRIADGTLPSPAAPNHDVLYMIYVADVSQACPITCGAYHGQFTVTTPSPNKVYYAVVGNAPWQPDTVTSLASHEIIEAATDPSVGFGYMMRETSDPCDAVGTDYVRIANSFGGAEVGDLCENLVDKNINEGGYALQRSWSNSGAATGDPCVPTPPGDVYVNVTATPSRVQSVLRGTSIMFTIEGWSTAPTADWTISAEPFLQMDFDASPKFSQPTLNNGGVATLTLTVPLLAKQGGFASIAIVSTMASGLVTRWPVSIEAE